MLVQQLRVRFKDRYELRGGRAWLSSIPELSRRHSGNTQLENRILQRRTKSAVLRHPGKLLVHQTVFNRTLKGRRHKGRQFHIARDAHSARVQRDERKFIGEATERSRFPAHPAACLASQRKQQFTAVVHIHAEQSLAVVRMCGVHPHQRCQQPRQRRCRDASTVHRVGRRGRSQVTRSVSASTRAREYTSGKY